MLNTYIKKVLLFPLYLLTKIIPRSPRIWVFGSWFGRSYSDNSRYLFEYVNENHKEIQAVWLTKDKQIYNELRKKGYRVELSTSFKGYWYAARAKVSFITQIVMEDLHLFASADSIKVQLWHGTPLKKIYFDDPTGINHNKFYYLKSKLLPYTSLNVDYVICPNQHLYPRFMSAFNVNESSIILTNSPRTDVIRNNDKENLNISKGKKLVAYVPTYRRNGITFLENIDRLDEVLERHDAKLVVKLHPKEIHKKFDFKSDRIILVNEEVKDINFLLGEIDVLITDYSSIYFDFLILDRPIIFTPFDLEDYLRDERNMYDNYVDVTPGEKCFDWNEVSIELETIFSGKDSYNMDRKKVSNQFLASNDIDSSKLIVDTIKNKIK